MNFKTFKERCGNYIFKFPIVVETDFINMERVYPLKQKYVKSIIDNLTIKEKCSSVILFGSSICMSCHKGSDIDLAIKLKEDTLENRNLVSNIIGEITEWNYDVIWVDDSLVNDKIYKAIERGIELYE